MTVRTFNHYDTSIWPGKRNVARAHLILHSDEEIKTMQETRFLLKLFPESEDKKILTVNYKLPKTLYGVRFIRVVNWFACGGFDTISCPLVDENDTVTNDDDLKGGVIAFGIGGVSKPSESFKVKDSCKTLNELKLSMQRIVGSAFTSSHSIVHLVILHEE